MARTTLAMAKASSIPEDLNLKPTDARFIKVINEGTRRLMYRGKYWGTYAYYTVAANSQLFTLPPHIDTVETIAVGRVPLPVRSPWFAYIRNGWGTRDTTSSIGSGIDECLLLGNFPTFKNITTASTLTVKCDVASDATKTLRIMGEDANGNWIRTEPAGAGTGWEDGEVVALAQGAGTATTSVFAKVTDIQPPSDLDGKWWLYEGTTAGTLIGQYEYWETSPSYKRYLIPFINSTVSTIEIMGKLAFRPAANDTDYLIIGNLDALKLACMACKAESEHNWAEAQLLWNGGTDQNGVQRIGALQELDFELRHHIGDGVESGINIVGPGAGFGCQVEHLE